MALTAEELTTAGLSVQVSGATSAQGTYDQINLDANNDSVFTISSGVEETPELRWYCLFRGIHQARRPNFRNSPVSD